MLRFLFSKFLLAFVTIFVTTILVTLLIHIVPGDPVQIMFAQSQGSTPEQIEQVRKNLGLDQPIYIQYFNYIGQLSKGDLGKTIRGGATSIRGYFSKTTKHNPLSSKCDGDCTFIGSTAWLFSSLQ